MAVWQPAAPGALEGEPRSLAGAPPLLPPLVTSASLSPDLSPGRGCCVVLAVR